MEPTSSTSVHPGLLAEIPCIKLASYLDEGLQDTEPDKQVIQADEPGTTEIMSNLV